MSIRNVQTAAPVVPSGHAANRIRIIEEDTRGVVQVNKGLSDLSIIGVPGAYHDKLPSVGGYPSKFNPEALNLWTKMVQDEAYRREMRKLNSPDLAWHNTILKFLKLCDEEGFYPFSNGTDVVRNDYIQDFVRRGRIHLVQFFNECELFSRVKIRKAYREYQRRDKGMTIVSWAECFPVKDPTFEKWLQQSPMPRFLKGVDNRYVKVIQPHVTAWVRCINLSRVTVGIAIEVAGTINVPGKQTPKRKEVDSFMDNQVWLPLIRAHRFNGVTNRLF